MNWIAVMQTALTLVALGVLPMAIGLLVDLFSFYKSTSRGDCWVMGLLYILVALGAVALIILLYSV